MNRLPRRVARHMVAVLLVLAAGTGPSAEAASASAPRTTRPRAISADVRLFKGRPTIHLNGRPESPVIYALTDCPGGRWTWEEFPQRNLRQFAAAGVRLFQADLFLEQLWAPDGSLNLALARRQIRGVLDACPSAAVFLRLHLNAPAWWNEKNPDECVAFADGPVDYREPPTLHRILDGDLDRSRRNSLASAKWRQEAGVKLREFCQQLAKTSEGNALAGIQVACGVFGEWHYWGFIDHEPDVGPAMTRQFREWLRSAYGNDAELQKAWGDPKLTLATAAVPGVADRRRTTDGFFRNPETERRVMDYFECQQGVVADAMLGFCKVAKESWPRPIITGAFYGYFFLTFGRQAAGGHLQMKQVLDSPHLDYLSAPPSYSRAARNLGGAGFARGLVESVILHGKLWLDEMDQRTSVGGARPAETAVGLAGDVAATDPIPDDIALLRRNVLQPLTRGAGLWFYDFGHRDQGGWWDHPALLAEVKQLKGLFDARLARQFKSPAEVLLVHDTESFYHITDRPNPISDQVIDRLAEDLYRSGAAVDMVLLSDLERVDWKRYRAVIFGNCWVLRPAEREFIRQHLARDNRHLIWNYLPGYSDGHQNRLEGVSQVAGLKLERIALSAGTRITVTASGLPAVAYGFTNNIQPLAAVKDAAAEPLGVWEGSEHIAFARRRGESSTSWFSAIPLRNPDLLRAILRQAGVHVYNDANDALFSGGGIVVVHTVDGGARTLRLRNGRTREIALRPRSTTAFDADTGEVLSSTP